MKKYKCNCCGYYTLTEKPRDPNVYPGTHEICPVCFWEDDALQVLDPDMGGGANKVSLNEARKNYKEFGAAERAMIKYTRKPTESEKKPSEKEGM